MMHMRRYIFGHFNNYYFNNHHKEFHRYYRNLRYLRPLALIFNLAILYWLFNTAGFKTVSIILAVFIGLKEILQFLFLLVLEKRILKPIYELKNGVEEIAKGNYDVKIECCVMNEIGLLIDSFNNMAQKLQESEKMKSEYEENRKVLIASISHDLKTPIASVQGYIEGILDGVDSNPDKVNRYLKIIYNNTVYLNKLIDDLFLFSKLDMQKLDFQYENIKVSGFMDDLMEEFMLELREKQVEFKYNNNIEEDCSVNIDGRRIHQAVRNIIGNAVKYGNGTKLSIETIIYRQNDNICIDIKDNGPGIPEDKLPHIFNRFYRIDTERTKDLMSTGLGLAIARELVEAHGGKITVFSWEKQGTCFTIMLPIAK